MGSDKSKPRNFIGDLASAYGEELYAKISSAGYLPSPTARPRGKHRSEASAREAALRHLGGETLRQIGISIDARQAARKKYKAWERKQRQSGQFQADSGEKYLELYSEEKKRLESELAAAGSSSNKVKQREDLARKYVRMGQQHLEAIDGLLESIGGAPGPMRTLRIRQFYAQRFLDSLDEPKRFNEALQVFLENYVEDVDRRWRDAVTLVTRSVPLDPTPLEVKKHHKNGQWLTLRYEGPQAQGIDMPGFAIYDWKPGQERVVPETLARELLDRESTISETGPRYGKRFKEFALINAEGRGNYMAHGKTTSSRVAKKASEQLRKPSSTKDQKSVAGSTLTQKHGRGKRGK